MDTGYRKTLIAGLVATLFGAPALAGTAQETQQQTQPSAQQTAPMTGDQTSPGAQAAEPMTEHPAAEAGRAAGEVPAGSRQARESMAEQHPAIAGTRDTELFQKSAQDLQGKTVVDSSGQEIGTVKSIVSSKDKPDELYAVITPSGAQAGAGAQQWQPGQTTEPQVQSGQAAGQATEQQAQTGQPTEQQAQVGQPTEQQAQTQQPAEAGQTAGAGMAAAEGGEMVISLDELRWQDDKLHATAVREDLQAKKQPYEADHYAEVQPADQPLSEFSAFEPMPAEGGAPATSPAPEQPPAMQPEQPGEGAPQQQELPPTRG